MRKIIYIAITILIALPAMAQEKGIKIGAGADVVSSYVWRGLYTTGASLQPSVSASAGGLTLGAWGSTDFSTAFKEFDAYLTYEIGGLTLGVTDYWWSGQGAPYFEKEHHLLEGTVGYYFGDKFPLSLSWNTFFYGEQDKDEDDKQLLSSYVGVGYDFQAKSVECTAEIGITPWKSMYHDSFDVMSLSLTASKKITLSSEFCLPVFTQVIFSPAKNDAFLVFGITF